MVSIPKCTKGRGLTMKKWEEPELKVLGVENTREWISTKNISAGDGNRWVCSYCEKDPKHNISDNGYGTTDGINYTSDTKCSFCGGNTWKVVPESFVPPNVELS